MRILIIHSRYLSGAVSGENRVVEDEARLLRDAGHDVQVWDPETRAEGRLELVATAARAIWSREATSRLSRLIDATKPEVVHCHNMYPTLSPAVLRVAASKGTAVVVTLHSYRLLCLPANFVRDGRTCQDCLGRLPWPGVVHRCYRGSLPGSAAVAGSLALHRWLRTFDRPRLFLAVSAFLREQYLRAGWLSERIKVKGNFAWSSPRREGPGEYFLYVGRLAPEKGVATLLSAWPLVPARLLVAGDGPQGDELRRTARPGVDFIGTVPPAEVPDLIRGARALLVPSTWYEGQPRAILEAYAAGVPVIASRFGGLPEVVEDGVSGLLLPPGDPEAWADAANRLLSDDESERLGAGALALWSKRYTPEHGLKGLEDAYHQALGPG